MSALLYQPNRLRLLFISLGLHSLPLRLHSQLLLIYVLAVCRPLLSVLQLHSVHGLSLGLLSHFQQQLQRVLIVICGLSVLQLQPLSELQQRLLLGQRQLRGVSRCQLLAMQQHQLQRVSALQHWLLHQSSWHLLGLSLLDCPLRRLFLPVYLCDLPPGLPPAQPHHLLTLQPTFTFLPDLFLLVYLFQLQQRSPSPQQHLPFLLFFNGRLFFLHCSVGLRALHAWVLPQ